MLKILGFLVLVSFNALAFEVSPDPPDSSIPLTAGRTVQCVGIDDQGVAYCNVVYTWKRYVNRFCCTYQRDLVVKVEDSLSWITPLPGKTDTRLLSVSHDGRHMAGLSMGFKASSQAPTLWLDGIPTLAAGSVKVVSNIAFTLNDVAYTYDGTILSPSSCQSVLALNNVGNGLCFKDLDPGNDDIGVRGVARFTDPEGDDAVGRFIVPLYHSGWVKKAAINNQDAAIVTFGLTTNDAIVSYPDETLYFPGRFLSDINDSNVTVGAEGVITFHAINAAGRKAGTLVRNGAYIGYLE